jgi:hypothetical protein
MGGRVPVMISLTLAVAALADTPWRDEADLRFAVDPTFQATGGVQSFYQLVRADDAAHAPLLASLRALDVNDRWSTLEASAHVVAVRFDYLVDKDRSFFSAERLLDVDYINAVGPEMKVTSNPDGSFHVGRAPANTFWLTRFGVDALAQHATEPAFRLLTELCGAGADSVIFQENRDFARVWGYRTGGASVAWTAHLPLGPGQTRVCVLTLTSLYALPPFFLGGERRVQRETKAAAKDLIERLRAYERVPPPRQERPAPSASPSPAGR